MSLPPYLGALPDEVSQLFELEHRALLVELRRAVHRDPELSFEEERTAARLEGALASLGIDVVERVAGTGVVARIRGRDSSAPVVALRGDIDALPIQEATGLPFASENPGVMHACGHDVHATWAAGAAALLAREPAAGDVVVLFQPAEEVGLGAPRLIEAGVLEGVEVIYGAHVDRRYEIGQVVVQDGPLAAATDAFELEIVGQGGHGARPQLGHDPIVAGSALVQALQTVVSRRVDPGSPAVVTVGSFHAGTASNVIPDSANLSGTLRSTTPETRELLKRELRHLCRTIGEAHHVEIALDFQPGTPPILNTPRETSWARDVAAELLGESNIVPMPEVNMGGEDFAFYLERVPGAFFRIGAREPGGQVIGAHTPQFHAAEEAIFVGAALLAGCARRASERLSAER